MNKRPPPRQELSSDTTTTWPPNAKTGFKTKVKTQFQFPAEVNLHNPVLNWTYTMQLDKVPS